ncbi:MAG TPA: DegT/DnrJ/EryC1/StrS family aminotransferase [Acidimicrobiales bacterium]|nr:DegT/DnrJ/EryC1/StrS family aminotransferase [Acidimicrobiales bacterium]
MTPSVEDTIPLVDLAAQHAEVAAEVADGFARVLATTAFVGGEDVAAFEAEFAAFCGAGHCVGVANGTDAIELALRAAGVGPGDEVIVPANTFVATAEAVVRTGATVAFVDCEAEHLLIDTSAVEAAIGPRTRAVIGVDLYGQVPDMEELERITAGAGILLFEDAAQSQGATRNGRPAGSFGVAAATSFYPGKNLGAYGDAGAVLTASDEVDHRLRGLRNHGGVGRYQHEMLGFNSRLDTLQAVVLRAKLRRLAGWNEQRRQAAARYASLLAGIPGVVLPGTAEGNEHVWHLYVTRVPRRDEVLASLRDSGIGAGIHYPVPVHLQAAFRSAGGGEGSFPVAEAAAGSLLSLPIYPGITAAQQERVAEALAKELG